MLILSYNIFSVLRMTKKSAYHPQEMMLLQEDFIVSEGEYWL